MSGASYVQEPAFALSQPDASHLAIAALDEYFGDHQASYFARATVAIPGGAPVGPTWLYVTYSDPAQLGDNPGSELPVNVQTEAQELADPKNGMAGYTYVGAIKVVPEPSGRPQTAPGGWPPPYGWQVIA